MPDIPRDEILAVEEDVQLVPLTVEICTDCAEAEAAVEFVLDVRSMGRTFHLARLCRPCGEDAQARMRRGLVAPAIPEGGG